MNKLDFIKKKYQGRIYSCSNWVYDYKVTDFDYAGEFLVARVEIIKPISYNIEKVTMLCRNLYNYFNERVWLDSTNRPMNKIQDTIRDNIEDFYFLRDKTKIQLPVTSSINKNGRIEFFMLPVFQYDK